MMPLIGWLLGMHVFQWTERLGPWIAFGLLFAIGIKMAYEGAMPSEEKKECPDPTRGFSLVFLSFADKALCFGLVLSLIIH